MYGLIKFYPMSLVMILMMLTSACVSTRTQKADSAIQADHAASIQALEQARDEQIVVQPKVNEPLLAQNKRSFWVNLRQKTPFHDEKFLIMSLATREWSVAEKDARAFLQKNPKNLTALKVLALSLFMQEKYRLASYYAQRIEKLTGAADSMTLNIRAMSLLNANATSGLILDRVESLLYEAFSQSEKELAAGLNLATLYLERGQNDKAYDMFAELRKRCHDCLPTLMGFGKSALRLKKYDAAQKAFEQASSQSPQNPEVYYYLAVIHENAQHDKKQAKAYLDKTLLLTQGKNPVLQRRVEEFMRHLDSADMTQPFIVEHENNSNESSNITPVIHE